MHARTRPPGFWFWRHGADSCQTAPVAVWGAVPPDRLQAFWEIRRHAMIITIMSMLLETGAPIRTIRTIRAAGPRPQKRGREPPSQPGTDGQAVRGFLPSPRMIFFGIMHRKIRMPERHTGGRPERAGISWRDLIGCMACRTVGYDLTDRSWYPASVPAANYQSRLQARPVCHSIRGADPATRPAVPPGGIRDGVANCTTTAPQTYGGSRISRPTLRLGANRRLGPWWRT